MGISGKSLYSTINIDTVSEKDISHFKDLCAEILFDIHDICCENNIEYIVAFGTLLGTVRHKGYIPWDDDIDIHIKRSDIPFFQQKLMEKYGDKYNLVDSITTPMFFSMLELKNTLAFEADTDNEKLKRGIKIDIFPLDYASENKFIEKTRRSIQYSLITLHALSINFRYPSRILKANPDCKIKRYYRIRRIAGCIASIFPLKFYRFLYRHLCIGTKETNIFCTDKPRTILPTSIMDHRILAEFEGHKVYIPQDYDLYLKTVYGPNYMELPPEEERETHSLLKIDFGPYK